MRHAERQTARLHLLLALPARGDLFVIAALALLASALAWAVVPPVKKAAQP